MAELPGGVRLGPLHVEAGNLLHRRLGVWLPDGLHIWLGDRGVHLFWAHSPHQRRVTLERATKARYSASVEEKLLINADLAAAEARASTLKRERDTWKRRVERLQDAPSEPRYTAEEVRERLSGVLHDISSTIGRARLAAQQVEPEIVREELDAASAATERFRSLLAFPTTPVEPEEEK